MDYKFMTFNECIRTLNWLAVIIITILSSTVAILISSANGKKMHREFTRELAETKSCEDIVKELKREVEAESIAKEHDANNINGIS